MLSTCAMRLFLDANVMTYVAVFEGFLIEGTPEELRAATEFWESIQGTRPDAALLREIEALRVLYLVDDHAHFDWLFSDLALAEIERISNVWKRSAHDCLLHRLFKHRLDIYSESSVASLEEAVIHDRVAAAFPTISRKMMNDARQYCEAELLDADYFVTNDLPFIRVARASDVTIPAVTPSGLPFVTPHRG